MYIFGVMSFKNVVFKYIITDLKKSIHSLTFFAVKSLILCGHRAKCYFTRVVQNLLKNLLVLTFHKAN
jgi:hypothetical protein